MRKRKDFVHFLGSLSLLFQFCIFVPCVHFTEEKFCDVLYNLFSTLFVDVSVPKTYFKKHKRNLFLNLFVAF